MLDGAPGPGTESVSRPARGPTLQSVRDSFVHGRPTLFNRVHQHSRSPICAGTRAHVHLGYAEPSLACRRQEKRGKLLW
jgi:hypothetical protein